MSVLQRKICANPKLTQGKASEEGLLRGVQLLAALWVSGVRAWLWATRGARGLGDVVSLLSSPPAALSRLRGG